MTKEILYSIRRGRWPGNRNTKSSITANGKTSIYISGYILAHNRKGHENRNTLVLAEKIRFEREQEFLEDREGYRLKKDKEVDLLRYFRKHREDEVYARSTRIGSGTAYRRFIDFLGSMPKYEKVC